MPNDKLKESDAREATHVKVGGRVERITSKWGIDPDGGLAKPSEGGFGVVTESGRSVSMWNAQRYFKEEPPAPPPLPVRGDTGRR